MESLVLSRIPGREVHVTARKAARVSWGLSVWSRVLEQKMRSKKLFW